ESWNQQTRKRSETTPIPPPRITPPTSHTAFPFGRPAQDRGTPPITPSTPPTTAPTAAILNLPPITSPPLVPGPNHRRPAPAPAAPGPQPAAADAGELNHDSPPARPPAPV